VLLGQVDRHRTEQEESGTLETRRQARRARELRELILAELRLVVEEALADGGALAGLVEDVETGRRDPHGAIREVVERLRAGELRDPVPDGRRARTSEAS
ncbi:MAG TPA: hypothetical protein VLA62_09055, partial [Solirubrobacterales bacterium]|nr:hypothetical protein [Solirubrobacterales bacterium]